MNERLYDVIAKSPKKEFKAFGVSFDDSEVFIRGRIRELEDVFVVTVTPHKPQINP